MIGEGFIDVFLSILNPDKLIASKAFLYKNGINSYIIKKFSTYITRDNYRDFFSNCQDFSLKEQKPREIFKKIDYYVDDYGTQKFNINVIKTNETSIKNRKYTLLKFIKFKKEINGNICSYTIYKHKSNFRINIKCEITDSEEKAIEAQDLALSFI